MKQSLDNFIYSLNNYYYDGGYDVSYFSCGGCYEFAYALHLAKKTSHKPSPFRAESSGDQF